MITVSASAIRIPFGIPAQTKWYPEDLRFVLIVVIVGAVVIGVAILGFKRLAQFSEVCVPWLFVVCDECFCRGSVFACGASGASAARCAVSLRIGRVPSRASSVAA